MSAHAPCPFCKRGDKVGIDYLESRWGSGYYHVTCRHCGANGPNAHPRDVEEYDFEGRIEALHEAEDRAWERWDGWADGSGE